MFAFNINDVMEFLNEDYKDCEKTSASVEEVGIREVTKGWHFLYLYVNF